MCGRYAASRSPEDLVEELEVEEDRTAEAGGVQADWNVAPTKTAPVVLERRPRPDSTGGVGADPAQEPDGASDETAGEAADEPVPVRQLRALTWGLVPSWAKDRSVGSRMINARVETLLDKPAYRRAAVARRCLVPVDGWYEWQPSPVARDQRGRPRKQPFFVREADGGLLALAGVYELWRDPDRDGDDPQAWLATFAVVTGPAQGHLERVHDRMPWVLPRDRWDAWLDPEVRDPEEVRSLLTPPDVGRLVAVPVSTRVNDVRNGGPELVEPIPLDQVVGAVDPVTGEVLEEQTGALF
ncbi:SOS response-associated peptidase [Thalassiella azotivora]